MTISSTVHNATSYSFEAGEQILFDANIWLDLYPAPGATTPNKSAFPYSSAFKRLVSSGGKPIVEPIILSEYLNRYYRIEWEVGFKSRYHSFKKFRKSLDFKSIASSAERYARAILQHSRVISSSLDAQDIETAVRSVGIGEVDFNDALIISICKKHNFKLMTHDADFHSAGIEILTTNTRLLPRC